jgi:serine/threonine protein phosphatase 1
LDRLVVLKYLWPRSRKKVPEHQWRGARNARCYAIGDVHGRLDLLADLLIRIEEDSARRPPKRVFVVLIGDLIDRGPDSNGVIELLRGRLPDFAEFVFILGNHEEVMIRSLSGECGLIADWLQFGGLQCAQSYGVEIGRLLGFPPETQEQVLKSRIPPEHLDFLRTFGDSFRFGDYLFVHAGIRPGIGLADQDVRDLRWIRDPFLESTEDHGMIVVHGHTIVPQHEEHGNRIAIDTGAFRSGILTAIAIEDDQRWYIATEGAAAQAA